MRISFNALSRPKRAAKAFADACNSPLSEAHEVVAAMCGYRDWHELAAVTGSNSQPPSPDDEDVSAIELARRRSFQTSVVVDKLGVPEAQAERIVEAVSPTRRVRSKPGEGALPLVGRNVFMPTIGSYFEPDFKTVCTVLYDVDVFAIEFYDMGIADTEHIASSVEFRFRNGKQLKINGAYFWKFLDSVPPELDNGHGKYLDSNPYTHGETEWMMRRFRVVYESCFATGDYEKLWAGPPERAEFDIKRGRYSAKAQAGVSNQAWERLEGVLASVSAEMTPSLLPVIQALASRARDSGYMEFDYRKEGRYVRPTYTPARWEAPYAIAVKDFLNAFSNESVFPNDCGGKKRFEVLLRELLEPYLPQQAFEFCKRLRDQGELENLARELNTYESSMTGIARALLGTKERERFAYALQSAMAEAHSGQTLGDLLASRPRALPKPKRVVDEAKPLASARGRTEYQSLRLQDPRVYGTRNQHSPLLDAASIASHGLMQHLVIEKVAELMQGQEFAQLKSLLAQCRSPDEYAVLEGAISHCMETMPTSGSVGVEHKTLFAIFVGVHAKDANSSGISFDSVASPTRIEEILEKSGALRSVTSWAVAPYFVAAEDVLALGWEKRSVLAAQILSGDPALPLPRRDFPKSINHQPVARILLAAASTRYVDALFTALDRAKVRSLLNDTLQEQFGKPEEELRILVEAPSPLISALRAHGDVLNTGRLWALLERAKERRERFVDVEIDQSEEEGQVGLKFVAGAESMVWSLPRSRKWTDIRDAIARLADQSMYPYLSVQFGGD